MRTPARDDGTDELRAFFAVELGEAAREAAARVVDVLRRRDERGNVRWIRPESLHVTLRFLGDVETSRLGGLVGAVARETAGVAPFDLSLGAVAGFPTRRRPRVVAVAVEPARPLARAAAAVERGVVAAGFAPEERPFRGHLTLGRVKRGRPPHLDEVTLPDHAPSRVRDVVLFRSELGSDGSRYTPLERIPLGRTGDPDDSEPRL